MPSLAGTGVLLQYAGQEYMATALHVARRCNFNPLIEYDEEWRPYTWEVIGKDEENDVAVLQRVGVENARIASTSGAMYGKKGVVLGAQAVALGFPEILDGINWRRVEGSLRPVPMTVSVSLYFGCGETHYSGGYVNRGFSGGAIVAWNGNQPSIVGIITKKAGVYITEDSDYTENAGLVGFADITVVERILSEHTNYDIEHVGNYKPPSYNPRKLQIPTLSTNEIIDAAIMLGRE